ncbi:cobalt/nickel transport system permease protein [Thermodesulfitimonas autotrophica]|uniref:Cobalt/nickel transport system permease protein n=1 Tax=Thermodesulfitimonas autotrophica TaxID=1894989 RepID=A0A3N5BI52_9THEO|nr:cobalt transporter CbiM [Thermodesulfitimonas autotrophica]RPF49348.1 cobalt/nickel transport system permease protein [Thermodesulfitimonas autotrophica]
MHIPDGYLSPSTSVVMYAAMVPVWGMAVKKVKETLKSKQVPLLALAAAFSFVIMMFNVPIPGGTTGHAVGGTLAAIVLGPWAACIAVSIALIIQALIFGDGGVWAIGANCFNMAFVLPFLGYAVYRAISAGGRNRVLGSVIGSYVGLNAAAFCAAVEFGIQPALFHTAAGAPLYCPYGLAQAIPAMMFAHLTVAGPIEAVITGIVVYYLQRSAEESLFYNATA